MEAKKNLCAMIPAELHNRLRQEQEQLGLTLSAYVERLINEHFEGGKTAIPKAQEPWPCRSRRNSTSG